MFSAIATGDGQMKLEMKLRLTPFQSYHIAIKATLRHLTAPCRIPGSGRA